MYDGPSKFSRFELHLPGALILPSILTAIPPCDDAALALRLKQRDPEALAELYDPYGRRVYFSILRVVRERHETEDLVQDTFLRIWNHAHLIDTAKGPLVGWVMAIARNQAIDHLRSVQARWKRESRRREDLVVYSESEQARSDRVGRLRDSFDRLTAEQRRLIELAFYEGLTHSEMAALLQKPLGTVKTRVRGALRALRERVKESLLP